jgi:hypothetical protein
MRLNRLPGVASNPEPAGGHRAGAGVVRALSVTAAAAAACAMGALPAMASSAHTTKLSSRTIVSAPKTAYTHTEVKLSVHVKGRGRTATGSVTFWLGTKELCRATLSNSNGSCDYKFANPATKTITGKYSGDSRHTASSGTATIKVTNKSATTPPPPPPGSVATSTTITNPPSDVFVHADAGVTVPLTVTVTPNTGDSVPTGTVAFVPLPPVVAEPNIECLAAPVIDGTATCDVTPAVGTWGFILYQATYTPTAGSEWATSNSAGSGEHKLITWDITTTLLTFNPSPATEGDPVTLTADVGDQYMKALSDAGGGADLVTFSIGGVAIPGCANVPVADPGDTVDNIATCVYTPATAGPVVITANYLGDLYALPSYDTETLTVNP